MRRDVFEELEGDMREFVRRSGLQALGFELLVMPVISIHLYQSCHGSTQDIVDARGGVAYLDVEVVVDLDNVPEHEDVLHEAGKLPHVAQSCQRLFQFGRDLVGRCGRVQLGLIASTLVARHGGWFRQGGSRLLSLSQCAP